MRKQKLLKKELRGTQRRVLKSNSPAGSDGHPRHVEGKQSIGFGVWGLPFMSYVGFRNWTLGSSNVKKGGALTDSRCKRKSKGWQGLGFRVRV